MALANSAGEQCNNNGRVRFLPTRLARVTGCTTFLKAHPTKYQTDNTLTLSAVATVLCAFTLSINDGTNMNFSDALEAVKSGAKIYREGWNGKGLWLELHKSRGTVDLPYIELIYPVTGYGEPPYPNGARVPWVPSQTDVLANDWLAEPIL